MQIEPTNEILFEHFYVCISENHDNESCLKKRVCLKSMSTDNGKILIGKDSAEFQLSNDTNLVQI